MESIKFLTEDTQILGTILKKISSHGELMPVACAPLIQLILFIAYKSSYSNPNYFINKVFVFTMLHSSPPPLNFGALSAWLPYLHFVIYKNFANFSNRITLVHQFFFVRYFVILCVTTCF
jgi:hypothetical protein